MGARNLTFARIALAASAAIFGFAAPAHAFLLNESNTTPAPQRPAKSAMPVSHTPAAPAAPAATGLAARARGPLQLFISLDKQQLTLYAGGEPIAHSRVSSGKPGHSSPTGVFSIIQKDRWHRSNLYDDAPMYFMQRITWSGVALHQGIVPNYPASHGCIRLPGAFAQELWATTRIGARVIVTRGEVAPVEIAHPRLFVPMQRPQPLAVASINYVEAAERAWTLALLDGSKSVAWMTATDYSAPPRTEEPAKPALKPGAVAVFVSRKEGKIFVRKGFEPIYEAPISIARTDEPIGTHVFTALALKDDGAALRWNVVSMASTGAGAAPMTAAQALDRVGIPPDARELISELVGPGASLIISDHGLGPETGKGTDFIVLTR